MVYYKKGWPQEVTHPFPTMKTIILIIPLINFGSVVLDLGVVSQGIVHTIVEHFIRELASLFPDDVTKIIGSGRLRELHVFDDESAAVARDGTHFFAFLHAKEGTNDVGFNTEVAQHTRINGNVAYRSRLGAQLIDHSVHIITASLHLIDSHLTFFLVEDLIL